MGHVRGVAQDDRAAADLVLRLAVFHTERRRGRDLGRGLAAAVGGVLFIPLKNRDEANTNALLYFTFSKEIKKKYGPTFTTGAYSFVGRMGEGETRAGVMLGYEQPLVPDKLYYFADWYSGDNTFGYAASGLGVEFPKANYIYAGYSFGNQGRGNNWLGIYLGHTFYMKKEEDD